MFYLLFYFLNLGFTAVSLDIRSPDKNLIWEIRLVKVNNKSDKILGNIASRWLTPFNHEYIKEGKTMRLADFFVQSYLSIEYNYKTMLSP